MAWPKGKPRGKSSASTEPEPKTIDPAAGLEEGGAAIGDKDLFGDVPAEMSKRPRGRSRARAALDPDGVTALLLSIHLGLSSLLAEPALALDATEGRKLAEAGVEVARHYDIAVLSPKAMAWLNLGVIAAGIYGPRIMAMRIKAGLKKAARAEASS